MQRTTETVFSQAELVKAGDLLVTIDPAPYAAEVQHRHAEGQDLRPGGAVIAAEHRDGGEHHVSVAVLGAADPHGVDQATGAEVEIHVHRPVVGPACPFLAVVHGPAGLAQHAVGELGVGRVVVAPGAAIGGLVEAVGSRVDRGCGGTALQEAGDDGGQGKLAEGGQAHDRVLLDVRMPQVFCFERRMVESSKD